MSKLDIYAKDSTDRLQPNFRLSEFSCKCGTRNCQIALHDPNLSRLLQVLRQECKKPVTITSGYRCPEHNKLVGGSATSYHVKGMAADIQVAGVPPKQLAQLAEKVGFSGIGLYDTFVHVDTRPRKYFWNQKNGESVATFQSKP